MWSALALFSTPLAKVIGVVIVAASLYGGYKLWEHRIYQSGYDAAMLEVAAQNKEAVDAFDQARARVRACNDTPGMRWSQARRQCERAE